MLLSKYRAILYASGSDAVSLPVSIDVIVCRIVPTALASSSCEMRLSARSSRINVLMAYPSCRVRLSFSMFCNFSFSRPKSLLESIKQTGVSF